MSASQGKTAGGISAHSPDAHAKVYDMGHLSKFDFTLKGSAAIFVVLWVLSLAWIPAFAAGLTNQQQCDQLKSLKNQASTDQDRSNLQAELERVACVGEAANMRSMTDWGAPVAISDVSPYLDGTDSNLLTSTAPDANQVASSTEARVQAAGQDPTQVMDSCQKNAAAYSAACTLSISQYLATPDSTYSSALSQMSGSTAEKACSMIPTYTSQSQDALSQARSACDAYYEKCQNDCKNAVRTVESITRSPTISLTPDQKAWISTNRTAGFASCEGMRGQVEAVDSKIKLKTIGLKNSCTSALEQAANAKPIKDTKSDNADKDSSGNSNLLNQALSAIPAVMNALNPVVPPIYPTATTNVDGTPSNPINYQTSTPMAPSVGKNGSYSPSSATSAGAGALSDDLLNLGGTPENYQKSKRLPAPNQGPGGAGGMPGGGSGSPPAANDKSRRRGGPQFDTNINSGYLSGGNAAMMPNRGRSNDDPTPGRGNPRNNGNAQTLGVSGNLVEAMNRFRPTWFARRELATVTGPDGITGPHTNMFRKVRIRYNEVPVELSFLGQ